MYHAFGVIFIYMYNNNNNNKDDRIQLQSAAFVETSTGVYICYLLSESENNGLEACCQSWSWTRGHRGATLRRPLSSCRL